MSLQPEVSAVAELLERRIRAAGARELPVLAQQPLAEIVDTLDLAGLAREGGLVGDRLARFIERYLATTINLHHPGYLGHQVAVPHPAAALGALVDAMTNNPMAIYEMGPGAAAIEYFVINWMLEKIGWTPAPLPGTAAPGENPGGDFGGGVLTHGGSLANLTALIAARSAARPEAWSEGDASDLAVLAPASNHYSIERAVGILGLGTGNIERVATDARGAMIPDDIPAAIARARDAGREPFALVASACSTAVGVYDPLRAIGEICREHGIWLHVDGAHGASALVSKRYRRLLDGVELADSLTWDAHKMMRTPSVCAALLVRDHRRIDSAFSQDASYLIHDKDQPGFDFLHRAVECTKSGLGLRFFMTLGALGEQGLAGYVERQYDLAAEAHGYLQGLDFVETAVAPEANILCFRLPGPDHLQLELRRRILAAGDFYLTSTMFQGRRWLRLVFMNPDTSLDDLERLIEQVRVLAAELARGHPGGATTRSSA